MKRDIPLTDCMAALRGRKPLVHHITNYVTANDCANVVLAAGASPVMADDEGESADITAVSAALVINMGTLNERTVSAMMKSGMMANAIGIPVILDPVGVGASAMRNRVAEKLLDTIRFSVIKGNASEVSYIGRGRSRTKGVDVGEGEVADLRELTGVASDVARRFGCVAAITGSVDVIACDGGIFHIANGCPEMGLITGCGCMCASLVASCAGAGLDPLTSAVSGVALMGVAGELAFERCGELGTGSLRVAIVDTVSRMTDEELAGRARISWVER